MSVRLRVVASRIHGWLAGRRLDEELGAELETHLALLAEENVRRGMAPEEAALAARRRLGGLARIKEENWRHRGLPALEALFQDLRYALRMLAKNPSYAATAVLTLALGIGANTGMFSLVDAVLVRPLPFSEPGRLLFVAASPRQEPQLEIPLSPADYFDLAAGAKGLASLAVFTDQRLNLAGSGEPEQVPAALVSANFFQTLGLKPRLGRSFIAEDDRPGSPPAVILSDALWRRRFGADPGVVGRAVKLNEKQCQVVGVMAAAVAYPEPDTEIWRTFQLPPPTRRGPYFLFGVGRLRPGTSIAGARAQVDAVSRRLQRDERLTNGNLAFRILPLQQRMTGDARPALLVLLGGVLFILLIACANIASLNLARSITRRPELALRAALGAGRARLLRQALTESLVLALASGALGVLLAYAEVRALRFLPPGTLPRLQEVAVDRRALAFAAGVALATGILFGLAPAFRGRSDPLHDGLREASHRAGDGARARRLRAALVTAEIAITLVLLIGAGLLLHSFLRLRRVDAGFRPERTLSAHLVLPRAKYGDDRATAAFWQRLLERVEALPGVETAAVGMSLPPDALEVSDTFSVEGQLSRPDQRTPQANLVFVSPHYFRALGVPLLRGRPFGGEDRAESRKVAMVSAALARRYLRGGDAVGRRIKTGGPERPKNSWMEIVGVVGDLRYDGLASAAEPALYEPLAQASWNEMFLVVRSFAEPEALAPALRRAVSSLDRDLPLANVRTMGQRLSEAVAQPRFRTFVLGAFSALALLLAAVGVFGLIAYTVAQRTHELGIRMALGARRAEVLRLVLAAGGRLVAAGMAIGAVAALGMSRLLSSLLFGISATDPATFALAFSLLPLVALAASLSPARRATRLDPASVLRSE
jgi:predicted permease